MAGHDTRLHALGVAGAPARGRLTTCFRFADGLVIDTGALMHGLSPTEQGAVQDILLSHSHLDHTLGLPFRLAGGEVRVWGLAETLDAVRGGLLDGRTWPDLSGRATWNEVAEGDAFEVGSYRIRPGPCRHSVPCLSFCVERDGRRVVLVGDTARHDPLIEWTAACRPTSVVVECSFPARRRRDALRTCHQSPEDLHAWRRGLGPDVALYVTHLKPEDEEETRRECEALADPALTVLRDGDAFGF
ncbi:MAG: MBL fold metallo-hydrolase [Planctomycetota bacterium]